MSEEIEGKTEDLAPESIAEGAAQAEAEVADAAAEAAEEAQEAVAETEEAADAVAADAAAGEEDPAQAAADAVADEAGQAEEPAVEAAEAEHVEEAADAAQAAAAPEPKKATGIGDLVIVGILALILGVLLSLPSFLSMTSGGASDADLSGGVAATVNGTAIGENDVTNYIAGFRAASGYEEDADFAEWLVSAGYTPESLREATIDYFATNELIEQACKENGVEVTDEEVDAQFAEYAEQAGGEETLVSQIQEEGVTVDDVKNNIKASMMQEALASKVVTDAPKADDETVLQMVKLYYPDAVDEDATSLDGVDEELVSTMRTYLEQSALQQGFSEWINNYKSSANIVVNDMPEGLPYNVDLTGVEAPALDNESLLDGAEVVDDDGADDEAIEVEVDDAESSQASE